MNSDKFGLTLSYKCPHNTELKRILSVLIEKRFSMSIA
jgi:hypothetical protein